MIGLVPILVGTHTHHIPAFVGAAARHNLRRIAGIFQVLHQAGYTWQQNRTWCDTGTVERKRKEGREGRESGNAFAQRNTNMFAKRDEYVMTEEEIAEYEKSEKEEQELKKKKKPSEDRY